MARQRIHTYKRGSATYAEVHTPRRQDGRKVNDPVYLGKVVDLGRGLFQSRARGVFRYTLDGGFEEADLDFRAAAAPAERAILDFGPAFLTDAIAAQTGLRELFRAALPSRADSLMALLAYRILEHGPYSQAQDWLDGSWASRLYPKAQLTSQRVSDLLAALGAETVQRPFFSEHIARVAGQARKAGVMIDSTGLPNRICFPLTAASNHNGQVSVEARLVLVVERATRLPLFFRHIPGNVVDVSTLRATAAELRALGVDVDLVITDAGYYSEANIEALYAAQTPFLGRLQPNRKLHKRLVADLAEQVLSPRNLVSYQDRLLGAVAAEAELAPGRRGWAYVFCDLDRHNRESLAYLRGALADGEDPDEMARRAERTGFFVIASSKCYPVGEVLPLYYERQCIEEVFGVDKSCLDILPLRVHSEATFKGHLMLGFMASLVYLDLRRRFDKSTDLNAAKALALARNLKCKVYDDIVIVQEPVKRMKQVASLLKLQIPETIALW
jgi:hypothetical protein